MKYGHDGLYVRKDFSDLRLHNSLLLLHRVDLEEDGNNRVVLGELIFQKFFCSHLRIRLETTDCFRLFN